MMNIEKRTKEVEYWWCGIDGHYHRTEIVARNCIKKRARKPMPDKKERNKRKLYIVISILRGNSFANVGKDVGITSTRVAQIYYQTMRMLRHPSRLGNDKMPEDYCVKDHRDNKDFWIKQVNKLSDSWGI